MKIAILITLLSLFQVSGSVTKNNGEKIALSNIQIFQNQDVAAGSTLVCMYRGKEMSMDLSNLKRVSLKESLGKKKGITTWKALLVTSKNEKFEVEMDLVEVKGLNSDGKEVSFQAGAIDKITL